MPTAYHMVHYRKFEAKSTDLNSKNFELLCREALDKTNDMSMPLWKRANDRLFIVSDAGGHQILLNKVVDLSSAIAGEMCFVQTQGLQAFLELKASTVQLSDITVAEIFNLDERSAPRGSQFIRGMGY